MIQQQHADMQGGVTSCYDPPVHSDSGSCPPKQVDREEHEDAEETFREGQREYNRECLMRQKAVLLARGCQSQSLDAWAA